MTDAAYASAAMSAAIAATIAPVPIPLNGQCRQRQQWLHVAASVAVGTAGVGVVVGSSGSIVSPVPIRLTGGVSVTGGCCGPTAVSGPGASCSPSVTMYTTEFVGEPATGLTKFQNVPSKATNPLTIEQIKALACINI